MDGRLLGEARGALKFSGANSVGWRRHALWDLWLGSALAGAGDRRRAWLGVGGLWWHRAGRLGRGAWARAGAGLKRLDDGVGAAFGHGDLAVDGTATLSRGRWARRGAARLDVGSQGRRRARSRSLGLGRRDWVSRWLVLRSAWLWVGLGLGRRDRVSRWLML